ncbi:MAG: GNAT family N-acetyltransferase [Pseudomonadota bacterium]
MRMPPPDALPWSLEVLGTEERVRPDTLEQMRRLHADSYHAYHYAEEAVAPGRWRFALRDGARLVGYASVVPRGRFGYLSNLVVHPHYQGCGLGTLLDRRRAALCRELELTSYVSCVTVGVQSQRTKVSLGLQRLNLKYGYRVGVFSPDDVSSAATYAGGLAGVGELAGPGGYAVQSAGQKRLRAVCADAADLPRALARAQGLDDFYVDLLCGGAAGELACAHPGLRFVGLDLDLERQQYGYLFQLKNRRYHAALRQGLDLAEAQDGADGVDAAGMRAFAARWLAPAGVPA